MKKRFFVWLTLFFAFSQINAQSSYNEEQPILTIEDTEIPVSDFLYLYAKNYEEESDAYALESLEEYYELFVKFKLKVFEAKQQGLHEEEAFIKEFTTYRSQLAAPYLTDSKVTDQLLREAHERLQFEVSAAHILIRVDAGAQPEDTLAAYNKIEEIRQKALAGENFSQLAAKYSEDPSAKKNKGELGYFTALQMVYPFENAAYNTSIGNISEPIRTRFGYHILKVNDKRPAKGEVEVAHILVRSNGQNSDAAEKKIQEIHKKILAGGDWEQLCKQFSEDPNSKNKGGVLRPFSAGMMIAPFSEAAFALQNPGDISEPVKTNYGWHIIKLIEKKLPGSFEEMKPEIERKIKRDTRNNMPRRVFVDKLKAELNFNLNQKVKKELMVAIDSSLLKGQFKKTSDNDLGNGVLFTLKDDYRVEAAQFLDYIKSNQRPQRNIALQQYLSQLLEAFIDQKIIDYEDAHLAEKYPEFENVEQEYYEGLLLFEIMENEVWNKAVEDSIGLRKYFEDNRDKYTWGKRLKTVIFDASDKKVLNKASKMYEIGIFPTAEPKKVIPMQHGSLQWGDTILQEVDQVLSLLKKDTNLFVKLECGFVKKEEKNLADLRLEKVLAYFYAKNLDSAKILETVTQKQKPIDADLKGGQMIFTFYTNSPTELATVMNRKNPLALQVSLKEFEQEADTLPKGVAWQKGVYTYAEDDRYYKMYVNEAIPGAPKTLNQTRGQVISDYQNYLEEQWIETLRNQYKVVEKVEVLEKIAKAKRK